MYLLSMLLKYPAFSRDDEIDICLLFASGISIFSQTESVYIATQSWEDLGMVIHFDFDLYRESRN